MKNSKFQIQLTFDLVSDKETTQEISNQLQELLKKLAQEKYLFVNQISVYQYKNIETGDALAVNEDGTPYEEPFEIKNVPTDVL